MLTTIDAYISTFEVVSYLAPAYRHLINVTPVAIHKLSVVLSIPSTHHHGQSITEQKSLCFMFFLDKTLINGIIV